MAITNLGSASLTITSAAIPGTDFTLLNDTCVGATLASSDTCSMNIKFTAAGSGAKSATLRINSNDTEGNQNLDIQFSGTSVAASIQFSPTSLDFGNVPTATTKSLAVTVQNLTSLTVPISPAVLVGSGYSYVTTCSTSILTSATCTVTISLSPTTASSYAGSFTFNYGNGQSDTINLIGMGTTFRSIMASTSALTFNNTRKGSFSTQTVTVTNNGTAALLLSNVTSTSNQFTLENTSSCLLSLAPSTTCDFDVKFLPTQNGLQSGTIQIFSNAENISRLDIAVDGLGTFGQLTWLSDSTPTIDPLGVDYGHIIMANQKDSILTFKNVGDDPIAFSQITLTGSHYSILNDNCLNNSVLPQAQCTLTIRSDAVALGLYTGHILIDSDDTEGSAHIDILLTSEATVVPTPVSHVFNINLIYPAESAKEIIFPLTYKYKISTTYDTTNLRVAVFECKNKSFEGCEKPSEEGSYAEFFFAGKIGTKRCSHEF